MFFGVGKSLMELMYSLDGLTSVSVISRPEKSATSCPKGKFLRVEDYPVLPTVGDVLACLPECLPDVVRPQQGIIHALNPFAPLLDLQHVCNDVIAVRVAVSSCQVTHRPPQVSVPPLLSYKGGVVTVLWVEADAVVPVPRIQGCFLMKEVIGRITVPDNNLFLA